MRVFALIQSVMSKWLDHVAGSHQRAKETNFQRRANRPWGQSLEQFLHLRALSQITARDVVAQNVLAKILQPLLRRWFMHSVNCWPAQAHQPGCNRLIRQEHEL